MKKYTEPQLILENIHSIDIILNSGVFGGAIEGDTKVSLPDTFFE